jgi:hypothetical protein
MVREAGEPFCEQHVAAEDHSRFPRFTHPRLPAAEFSTPLAISHMEG